VTGQEAFARAPRTIAAVACLALVCAIGAAYAFAQDHRQDLPSQSAAKPAKASSAAAVSRPPLQPLEAGRPAPSYDDVSETRVEPALEPQVERFKIDRAVSITGLLRQAGIQEPERDAWAEAFRSSAHWGILSPGHEVKVFRNLRTGRVQALEYDLDDNSAIRAESVADGVVFATRQPLAYQPETVAYTLSLAQGLNIAAARRHLPSAVLEQIKDAFATRLPQLDAGGTLKLVYKELVSPDGLHHRNQDLQACKIQQGRHSYCAFSFNDGHGREHLYDENGNSLEPQFLRFPVAFQYISSSFSPSRYHPILHVFRPHAGIDLAARDGTPVKAVSDGVIQFADWEGELGRCIRIQHDNSLISVYAHLSMISPDIRPGTRVRIGQVIGYVGSTGLSTGPHLHYALIKNGQFVDPLTANLDEGGGTVANDRRPLFESFKNEFERVFARLHGAGGVPLMDPAVSRMEAFNADAEPPVSYSVPSSITVPAALLRAPRTPRREHLVRGGLLREGHQGPDNSPIGRLIRGGLLGDPSL
jgi:murein DD-endopeptidase MepM/ murein hydrolase activator NlpD